MFAINLSAFYCFCCLQSEEEKERIRKEGSEVKHRIAALEVLKTLTMIRVLCFNIIKFKGGEGRTGDQDVA